MAEYSYYKSKAEAKEKIMTMIEKMGKIKVKTIKAYVYLNYLLGDLFVDRFLNALKESNMIEINNQDDEAYVIYTYAKNKSLYSKKEKESDEEDE